VGDGLETVVFRVVTDKMIQLVKAQIEATGIQVKAVLLVGGYGQSAYLRDAISKAVAPIPCHSATIWLDSSSPWRSDQRACGNCSIPHEDQCRAQDRTKVLSHMVANRTFSALWASPPNILGYL
jgi:hypothetical protein